MKVIKRLSVRENKSSVTAMPYGLSVPHYFAVAFGVIGVVYSVTGDWTVAWAAGVVWNLVQGLIMAAGAFIGIYIKRYVPRAAMLGALAGLAITYISMNPVGQVFTTPYIGMMSLAIVLTGWLALKTMPFRIPAGAFAIILGTILAWATGYMNPAEVTQSLSDVGVSLPNFTFHLFSVGFEQIAPFLPAAIPLAIYDFIESLDNLESAEAGGEKYNVPKAMMVPAGLTILGSCLGSPFPTIIYIGHPGWKAAGAHIGYSWLTGVSILLIAFVGLLNLVLSIIPLVALFPILMYIGMVIVTQAFAVTEKRHMPAVALSFMPLIAGFVTLNVTNAIQAVGAELDYEALAAQGIPLLGWERLSGGDILVGMVLASIVVFLIDRKFMVATVYSLVAAVLSFFGFLHAAEIGIGTGSEAAIGYLMFALVMLAMHFYRPSENSGGADGPEVAEPGL